MDTSSKQDLCKICHKPKFASRASITQWVFRRESCDCEARSISSFVPLENCATCGNRIDSNSFSITQWIVRRKRCECLNRSDVHSSEWLLPEESSSPFSREPGFACEGTKTIEEQEIPVNPQSFPLDRYKPLAILGRGAAGTVFLARDRLLAKKVALKILHQLTAEQLIAFQEEARATSRLNHENIVHVLDFGATKTGAPYMVMEVFAGESLESWLKKYNRLSEDLAIHIALQVCEALNFAHQHRIFHRDIKPSNIMLSNEELPTVCLIDFGIAKVAAATGTTTTEFQNRTLAGTPSYLSPDPAMGRNYDERSEIYSLGCVLFEMMTGEPPFAGMTALETIGMHVNQPPRQLTEVCVTSTWLEKVVSTCLEKDPTARYQTMKNLQDALWVVSAMNKTDETWIADRKERKRKLQTQKRITAGASLAAV
ncbi:MAG: serine/threonine protein kinase, partial [Cyanobacteria bacterium]|nr:serine/threonine protein kinase [Cyanobacteriota bacterium]